MRRSSPLLAVGMLVAASCVVAVVAFFALPGLLVDDARFPGAAADARVEQQRLEARHHVRLAALQLVGALALITGGGLTWRTVSLTRQGQITDRLAKAVEQLGETEKPNIRVGAIFALGRVARDSRTDHAEVMALLGEHMRRTHPAVDDDGSPPPERRHVDAEVRAVAMVLRTRRAGWDPTTPRLNFSGIDFGQAPLQGADLRDVDLQGSHLRGAHLSDADLRDAGLDTAKLRGASLQRSRLDRASLRGADLGFAHARKASFRGADLDEVTWHSAELAEADLRGATGMPVTARELLVLSKGARWPEEQAPLWFRATSTWREFRAPSRRG